MKRIAWVFWGFLALLTGLWLMADTLLPAQRGYFDFRTVWVQYTGVIAMGVMSLAMLLAVRPVWLERHLDGLDKMYRLHKWLGIGALVVGTVHWLWAKGTKWAVGWGWLTKPARGAGGGAAELGAIEAALRGWRGTAETMGEWAFYGAVLLIVLALVKRFPYRLFAKTHKLLAVAYLVLVFHTVVLTKIDYWAQPVGWVQAVLLVAGTVSAVIVLLGRIGARRTAHGTIESLERFPTLHCWRPRCCWMSAGPATSRGSSPFSPPARRRARTPTPSPRPGTRRTGASASSPRRWATTPARCTSACAWATA